MLCGKFNVSCQNNNQKLVRADYIYLKIDKKTKGQTPENGFVLIDN